jgi:predicted nicotinamide N-methyase
VGDLTLNITMLVEVEKAIDHVFNWLETKGRDASEIESLAPYFGTVWPSALALIGFLRQERIASLLPGKQVLELGCGLALPSMVCSRMGAIVTAMDHHPDVPRFLELNVSQNEPCAVTFVASADDKPTKDFLAVKTGTFDYIIASDVLYESHLAEFFANQISILAAPQAKVVVADPGRPYIQSFVNAMGTRGWRSELQPWTAPYMGKINDIYVLIFER